MQYYPLLLYSGVPIVASFAYDFLARALNEFEDHPTAVRKKNALIIKVNEEYASCYYIAPLGAITIRLERLDRGGKLDHKKWRLVQRRPPLRDGTVG